MGNLAGGRRREKGHRAVIPLAGWSETRRRECVPLARWPERRWCTFERAYGARKLAAPLRATFREAIGNVVVLYEKALALPKEPSAEEFHDARLKLAAAAEQVAAVGGCLSFLRTPETLLMRSLVRMSIGEGTIVSAGGEVIRPPLGPESLRDLATMLKSGAWRYRPGRRGNFALMEFVSRLDRLSEALCGKRLTLTVRRNTSSSDSIHAAYSGTFLEVVQLLQSALPRGAGSIAECSTSTLAARLRQARDASRRSEVTPIP